MDRRWDTLHLSLCVIIITASLSRVSLTMSLPGLLRSSSFRIGGSSRFVQFWRDPRRVGSDVRFGSQISNFSTSSSSAEANDNNQTQTDDTDPRVLVTSDDATGIVHIQLNRPHKLNALDLPMFQAIVDAARPYVPKGDGTAASSNTPRVIILSGKGRAFCSGLDVKSMFSLQNNPIKMTRQLLHRNTNELANLAQQVAFVWRQIPCPVISILHGQCYGGGLQIALGTDIRIATQDCKVSIMEGKWGLLPDMSATVTLRELGIPLDVLKEWTWTAQILDACNAKEYGLVTHAHDPTYEQAFDHAQTLATEFVSTKSPDAIALTKHLYQQTFASGMSEGKCLQLETHYQKQLLASWNQMATSGRNFGWKIPYKQTSVTPVEMKDDDEEEHGDNDHKPTSNERSK